MTKNILQALPELVKAEVISPETAEQIRNYYRSREGKPAHVLFIVFGILGALLVGLGIILMLAHNWDELPRATRTALAFLPLILGQVLGGYVLLNRAASIAWRESAATFLFLAVGASISLVSQIYHIPGNLGTFLLTWVLLGLPLVYLLHASIVSLLYLLGITFYAVESRDLFNATSHPYFYWLLLLGILPHYYQLYRQRPESNFTFFHHWLLPLSTAIALITVGEKNQQFLFIAFFSLFSLYCSLGNSRLLAGQRLRNNGYLVVGTLGTIGLLLALSFDFFWRELVKEHLIFPAVAATPEFTAAALLTLLALTVLLRRYRHQELTAIKPVELTFLLFLLAFFTAFLHVTLAVALLNLLVLFLGIDAIRKGARSGHLGMLNYGLLLVAALITCRFFDTDLSFVFRGFLFVLVGLGFFFTNYWMLQKRKSHE
jgi:uncharacterized membrane protein